MTINGLAQPPYDTSVMGVVKGAFDYYGIACSPGDAFVGSGHAFVINIHEQLCTSGPYCWRNDRCFALLRNLGLDVELLGALAPTADGAEKARLEASVRAEMDQGTVCSLLNLDHQLLLGYDDEGFMAAQPWGDAADSTPARLSYGTWAECLTGPPIMFFKLTPANGKSSAALAAALDFGLDVWHHPQRFAECGYGLGERAYDNWIQAIDAGYGDGLGNWWNAVVWGECKARAGDYFQHLAAAESPAAESLGTVDRDRARELAVRYRSLAKLLYRVSDKTAAAADKRRLVGEARDLEADCMERIAGLRGA